MVRRLAWILLLMMASPHCKRDDCPGTFYQLNISLGNRTDHRMDVELFPRNDIVYGDLYIAGTFGNGFKERKFFTESSGAITWFNSELLYFTDDTLIDPAGLMKQVFDSISIIISDSAGTRIFISHDSVYNYEVNPFLSNLKWTLQYVTTSRPDNDCENPVYIKDYIFTIDQALISP